MFKVGVYLEDPTATLSYSATGVDPDDLDEPDAGCIDDLIKGRQHAKWRVLFKAWFGSGHVCGKMVVYY